MFANHMLGGINFQGPEGNLYKFVEKNKGENHSMLTWRGENYVAGQAHWASGTPGQYIPLPFTVHRHTRPLGFIIPTGVPSKSICNIVLVSPLCHYDNLSHILMFLVSAIWTPFPTVKFKAFSCWTNCNIFEETDKVIIGILLWNRKLFSFSCKASLDNWKGNSWAWNCFITHLHYAKLAGSILMYYIIFYVFLHLFLTTPFRNVKEPRSTIPYQCRQEYEDTLINSKVRQWLGEPKEDTNIWT